MRLAVRFTPYWRLAEGAGCVARSPDDRTLLRLRAAGEVRLVTTFALGRIGARSRAAPDAGAPEVRLPDLFAHRRTVGS